MDDNILLNELITSYSENTSLDLTPVQLDIIKSISGKVLVNFTVYKQSTELVKYNPSELPNEAKQYIASRGIEGLSKGTLDNYRLRLTQFFTDTSVPIAGKSLNQITTNMIRAYLFNYSQRTANQNKQVSQRTVEGIRIVLSAFFGWANAEGYCDKNPMITVKKIKYPDIHKDALNETELESLRESCTTVRDKAILEFFFSTGARVSEVCNCKRSDIDLVNGSVKILGKGNKLRTDYLSPKAILSIKNYLELRNDNKEWLFITEKRKDKITKSGMEYIIYDLWQRSGIEKKVTPHILRHTTATLALKRGMPIEQVQKILGHTNLNTTMIYAEVLDDDVRNSHARVII